MIMLGLLVLALAFYGGINLYNTKAEEKALEEEEAAKVYVTEADASDIISFSYEVNGETLTFSKIDDTWYCSEYTEYELDQDKVESIASDFDHATATQIVEDAEDLSEYGFDSPTEILTYTTSDETTYILTVGMENDITGDYYLTTSANDNLYLVDSSFATGFDTAIEDLIAEEEETETETETDAESVSETESDASTETEVETETASE